MHVHRACMAPPCTLRVLPPLLPPSSSSLVIQPKQHLRFFYSHSHPLANAHNSVHRKTCHVHLYPPPRPPPPPDFGAPQQEQEQDAALALLSPPSPPPQQPLPGAWQRSRRRAWHTCPRPRPLLCSTQRCRPSPAGGPGLLPSSRLRALSRPHTTTRRTSPPPSAAATPTASTNVPMKTTMSTNTTMKSAPASTTIPTPTRTSFPPAGPAGNPPAAAISFVRAGKSNH